MNVKAILFDVQSIQKYIFASNKLKANIGASYIVDTVFESLLCNHILETLQQEYGITVDTTSWRNAQEITDALPTDIYVASIGGGNALVLVNEGIASMVSTIIQQFTLEVLLHYPGLKIGAASGDIELDSAKFQLGLSELYKQLKVNQFTLNLHSNLANTGLTTICNYSNEVADKVSNIGGER